MRGGKILIFSGDIGNPAQKLLQPTERIKNANIIIMESTYGDRIHPREDALNTLQKECNEIEASGGVLLIPAFALDRTQVLLHLLNHLKKDRKITYEIPVFLDSPMGMKATEIYKQSKDMWSDELKSHTDNPFGFPNLNMTQNAVESENIMTVSGPKIIIAGNGMMTGGRIWHHLINYLPILSTRLLVVGYQGEGTIGREIIQGAKQVAIFHEEVQVGAKIIQAQGLSAHADQIELLHWLQNIQNVEQVFITHGEDSARQTLEAKIKKEVHIENISLPIKGSSYKI